MLDELIEESVSMATDHERYRNIKDSFENYHQKLDLDNVILRLSNILTQDKEGVYKFYNRLMFKVAKKKALLNALENKLVV